MVERLDQRDLDFRDLVESDDRIVLPRVSGDASVIEFDLLFQRPADRLNDSAFDLVPHAVGIYDETGVNCTPNPPHANFVIDLDLRDHSNVCGRILISSETDAEGAARATFGAVAPSGHARSSLKDLACARIAEISHAEFERIDICGVGQFVHE